MNSRVAQIVKQYASQVAVDKTSVWPPGHYFNPQAPGEGIVASTRDRWSGSAAYGVMNDGTSQTPIAIQFRGKWASAPIILRPGEAIYPGEFDSFDYGVPFGWPGGGVALLKVALAKDVRFAPPTQRPEIWYWATALVVEADGGALPAVKNNWPSKFPWEYAYGKTYANQTGKPALSIEPTRTLLFLFTADKAGGLVAGTIYGARLYFRGPFNSPDMAAGVVACDVSWAAPPAGALPPQGLVTTLPSEFDRLDVSLGGVTITSPDGTLVPGDAIGVVRYGRL